MTENIPIFRNPIPFDRKSVPEPVIDEEPVLAELYYKAWELAWDHVTEHEGVPQSPYMSEGFSKETIWIWDTCFMTHFCKYAPETFPGIESFRNFYRVLHDGSPTSLRIQHPDNPPLFAWIEYEYFRFTGDISHLKANFPYLLKHYDLFEKNKQGTRPPYTNCGMMIERKKEGYLWAGCPSGMDNTPRGNDDYSSIFWVDALAQQALAALYIKKIAGLLNDGQTEREFGGRYDELKELGNRYYWDKTDGLYYDVRAGKLSEHVRVKSIASFWPLMAGLADSRQAETLSRHIADPGSFGGEAPFPSIARNDPYFVPEGMYWRGGIWLPTAYMAVKALEKYGYYELADGTAYLLLKHMLNTYKEYEPHTIWEAYNPREPKPSTGKDNKYIVRPEFCGWSALGPISLFIENVLGFHDVDALQKRVSWRRYRKGKHGIKRLSFGGIMTDIVSDGDKVEVTSNEPYTLVINGKEFQINKGKTAISSY